HSSSSSVPGTREKACVVARSGWMSFCSSTGVVMTASSEEARSLDSVSTSLFTLFSAEMFCQFFMRSGFPGFCPQAADRVASGVHDLFGVVPGIAGLCLRFHRQLRLLRLGIGDVGFLVHELGPLLFLLQAEAGCSLLDAFRCCTECGHEVAGIGDAAGGNRGYLADHFHRTCQLSGTARLVAGGLSDVADEVGQLVRDALDVVECFT